MAVTVHALGAAEIEVGGTLITPASTKKFGFLLYLASERGRRVPRAALQELLFPDAHDKSAAHALRELTYQLRHAGGPVQTDKASVGLRAEAVRSDFSEVVEAEELDERQVRAVEGGFLPGYAPSFSRPFADWLDGYRARMTREIGTNLLRQATRLKDAGEIGRATKLAQAVLALEPLNEDATLIVAESLALGGSKVQAMELLESYRRETGLSRELTLPAGVLRKRIMNSPVSTSAQRVSVFAGRQAEMAAIAEALKAGERGEARIVALTGEPGIGKTRIATEASSRAALQGWKVVNVRTQPGDQQRPLAAFADVVPQLMNAPGALGCSPENIAWLKRLIEHDPRTSNDEGRSYEGVAAAISGAIKDLIDAVAGESPLLFVIDDVQWADRESVRLLREIITDGSGHRLTVLVTSRTAEATKDLGEQNHQFAAREVGPLNTPEIEQIISARLARPVESDLEAWIVEVSQGNPFFLESLIHHFEETGDRFVIPPKVSQLVDQRLMGLTADARHILGIIVRLGKRASLALIARVLELSQSQMISGVTELEKADLIRSDAIVRPSHWLISESEGRLSTRVASNLMHLRIAEVLNAESQTNPEPALLWELADHFEAAGESRRAASILGDCADHAERIGRTRDAAELHLKAASLGVDADHIDHLSSALRCAASVNEVDLVLRAADALSRGRGSIPSKIALDIATARLANECSMVGEFERLLGIVDDERESFSVRIQAARVFAIACDNERRLDVARAALPRLGFLWTDSGPLEVETLRVRLVFETIVGDLQHAKILARRVLALAEKERPDLALNLQRHAAIALLRAGSVAEAIKIFHQVYRGSRSLGLVRHQHSIAIMIAHFALDLAAPELADEWFQAAIAHQWDWMHTGAEFYVRAYEAEKAFLADDDDWFARHVSWAEHYRTGPYSVRFKAWCRLLELYALQAKVGAANGSPADWVFDGLIRKSELGELADAQIALGMGLLVRQQRCDSAKAIFHEYVGDFRRGITPMSASLQHAYRLAFNRELPGYGSDVHGEIALAQAALQSPRASERS